jgi:hypothetical protein
LKALDPTHPDHPIFVSKYSKWKAKRDEQKEKLKNLSIKLLSKLKSDHYQFLPLSGSCYGTKEKKVIARSLNNKRYPTFSYNFETGEKTCSHNGPNEELHGCSARRDGEW